MYCDLKQEENQANQHATSKVLDVPLHASVYPKPSTLVSNENTKHFQKQNKIHRKKNQEGNHLFEPKLSLFMSNPLDTVSNQTVKHLHDPLSLPMPTISVLKDTPPLLCSNTKIECGRRKYHSFLGKEWMHSAVEEEKNLL